MQQLITSYYKKATLELRLLLLFALLSVGPCSAQDTGLSLPKPTGKYAIGTKILELTDEQRGVLFKTDRNRKLPLQVWYPTDDTSGKRAPYLPDNRLLQLMLDHSYNRLDSTTLASMAGRPTHARLNAPLVKKQKFPLILFSHGQGVSRVNYTAIAEELVSQGYVVLMMEHPYGGFTILRDGRFLSARMDTLLYSEQADETYKVRMAEWSQDAIFVLNKVFSRDNPLGYFLSSHIDHNRIAAMGHSLGGNVALKLPTFDKRIKAGINLDGGSFQNMEGVQLDAPTLTLRSQPVYAEEDLKKRGRSVEEWEAMGKEIDRSFQQALAGATHAYEIKIAGAGHMSFSDAPFILPEMINRFGGKIIPPQKGHDIIMQSILRFLKTTFYSEQQGFESFVAAYPEITIKSY